MITKVAKYKKNATYVQRGRRRRRRSIMREWRQNQQNMVDTWTEPQPLMK